MTGEQGVRRSVSQSRNDSRDLRVLRALAEQPYAGLPALTRHVGMSVPTVRRALQTLARVGEVLYVPSEGGELSEVVILDEGKRRLESVGAAVEPEPEIDSVRRELRRIVSELRVLTEAVERLSKRR